MAISFYILKYIPIMFMFPPTHSPISFDAT